jgi:hypothetical protein
MMTVLIRNPFAAILTCSQADGACPLLLVLKNPNHF